MQHSVLVNTWLILFCISFSLKEEPGYRAPPGNILLIGVNRSVNKIRRKRFVILTNQQHVPRIVFFIHISIAIIEEINVLLHLGQTAQIRCPNLCFQPGVVCMLCKLYITENVTFCCFSAKNASMLSFFMALCCFCEQRLSCNSLF